MLLIYKIAKFIKITTERGYYRMPGYKGHLVGGALAFGVVYYCTKSFCPSTITVFHWFFSSLAGALFPDIDVKSKGQKYGYWILLIAFMILIIENKLDILALLAPLSLIPMLVRHRGLFHRPWFVLLLPLSLWVIVSAFHPHWAQSLFFVILFFISGAISHLWLDFGFFPMMRLFFR